MTTERNKQIEALAFVPSTEKGPMDGKLVEAERDSDEEACTLLIRDFPEDEPLDDLNSRMLDFAPLRCPPKRQKDGQIHLVFYTAKDMQSVLDWYAPRRAPRFFGHPVQLFSLKHAPPYKVWTLD